MEKRKEQRSNKWTFILYRDSAPSDYLQVFERLQVPYILSPWHDKDKDAQTGKVKKEHRHCGLFFDSLKSYSQVSSLVSGNFNSPKHVEIVLSPTGMYHYFTHAENPEKTPYPVEDIECGCGFELEKFLVEHNSKEFLDNIIDIIEEYDFVEFEELVLYARNNNSMLLELLINKTYFFTKLLDSKRYSIGRKTSVIQKDEMNDYSEDRSESDGS